MPKHTRRSAPVLVDFESRSRANLRKRGGRLYWEDPSSEVICAVLHDTATGETTAWQPGDEPPSLDVAVAHNAFGFDRHAARRAGWRVRRWVDSSALARRAGLPGALDELGKRWAGKAKDKASSRFTVALSTPSRAKARLGQLPDITPAMLERVVGYCADDVEIMTLAWDRLDKWQSVEEDVLRADQAVNERGIYLDRDLVRALQRQFVRQIDRAVRRAAKRMSTRSAVTRGVRSIREAAARVKADGKLKPEARARRVDKLERLVKTLRTSGWTPEMVRKAANSNQQFPMLTGLPNAQKETLADRETYGDLLDHPLVSARKALASVVPGKLAAALAMCSEDGRLRDMLLYCGAHTWRWAGRGLQPHNLNRISFEEDAKRIGWRVEDYIEALIDGAMTDEDLTKHQVSGVLRSVLRAAPGKTLAVLDYSGIEARGLAWAARDVDALRVFRELDAGTGPDPYCVMATKIFGREITKAQKEERGLGKIAELMLGYGAGADKFAESCEKGGADLEALGVSAEDVVTAYRTEAHPRVAELWKACQKAFLAACQGRTARAGKWRYEPHEAADGRGGVDVWCVLPSGRPIVYSNARAKRVQRKGKDGRKFTAWDLSYDGRRFRERVYGGLLVENAVQAFCRDLLADALVRCEDAELCPVLHVHDEMVCELDADRGAEGLEEMREIMASPPRWARGLPIRLDGFHGERYRK
jgi:DNA polymerase